MSTFRKVTMVQRRNQRKCVAMTRATTASVDLLNRPKAMRGNARRQSLQQAGSSYNNNTFAEHQQSHQPSTSSATTSDYDHQTNEQQPCNCQKA